ncbi:MAG: rhomboid family intramembrane serine protease [Clostridia bacterium]|nr:rhomboid family intramembrane serine protease [Clostridia bacterium]
MNNRINPELERKIRPFTIPNLMQYIVIGQGVIFALMYIWPTLGYRIYSTISLSRSAILQGQIWRLLTFVICPPSSSPIFIIFALYFYYFIGQSLERMWGTVRFNLFYWVGMLGAIIACMITGYADNSYLNLSLFFAYAAIWPDQQVLLFMIIPIKMKYLALFDALIFIWRFIVGSISTKITILLCLVNVFLFVGGDLSNMIRNEIRYFKTRQNYRNTMWR